MTAAQPVIIIRPAVAADVGRILAFIRELAEYEQLSHEVVADETGLTAQLFGDHPRAEVLITDVDGTAAGSTPSTGSRSPITTDAPSARKRSAMARPIPRNPPVTSAVLP